MNRDKNFKDHFSNHSKIYSLSRPGYPNELYEIIYKRCISFDLAWDCATGNGQAAKHLSKKFNRVFASDASIQQISNNSEEPNVVYKVEDSGNSSLEDASVDLITVATAVHWFDLDSFYSEAKRVLKKNAPLAVWSYAMQQIDPAVDSALEKMNEKYLVDYWPSEIELPLNMYRDLPFPFDKSEVFTLENKLEWNLHQYSAFIRSWSATDRMLKDKGEQEYEAMVDIIKDSWSDPDQVKEVKWPIALLIGMNE